MRYVRKKRTPQALKRWVQDQKGQEEVVNLSYDNFPSKQELKDVMIGEQHQRCAYTCRWIHRDNSKVEHLKPQSECRAEIERRGETFGRVMGDDLDYENMVAALNVPGSDPYGEAARGNWYDPALFVSPLNPACETRFRYLLNGTVESAADGDAGVEAMIRHLRLNHDALKTDREREIAGFFPEDILSSMTKAELELIMDAMEPPTKTPRTEFATVVRLIAQSLLS